MSRVDVEQPLGRRLRVADLHPHLMCVLCGGYYVDATTIIECLHSFCKSCLVRYLESNKYCPICEVQVHKTKPLLNIRPDETLQNMVYKLVPGLFFREMKFRREFYAQHPEANPDASPEHKGLIDPIECEYYSPEELVSLALEFKSNCSTSNSAHTRYLRCPAAVTVGHLQKLVRNKFDLSPSQQVEVMFDDNVLTPDLSIMDVAYTFQRKRKEQFHLTYRILERESKKRKLDEFVNEENSPEKMAVDPPALTSANSSQPSKPSGPSAPETKSKLDSIISRLGIAKQTESLIKKDKGAEEWKEVQLQISESGVMSVTDISSIDKLINTIEKNVGPLISKDISSSPKHAVKTEKGAPPEIKSKHEFNGAVSPSSAASKEVKGVSNKSLKEEGLEKLPSKSHEVNSSERAAEIKEVKSEVKSEVKKEVKKETKHNALESRSMPSLNALSSTCNVPTSACTVQQNIPTQTSTTSFESTCSTSNCSQSNAAQTSCATSESLKGPPELGGSGQSNLSTASYSVCSSGSNLAQLSLAVNQSSTAALTTTTTARAAPLPTAKPSSASAKRPIGYKTLKCGPKNWNPTISRSSFLSSKVEQPLQQGGNTDPASSPASSGKSLTAPRFFKMRNTPRYLGNPASGVKAMYQVPESKPESPPSTKSPSVMKLDPRTLTPIVSNASSPASKSSPVQPKGRPPFPSTTLSAQVSSNHLPSSRSIATTTTSSPTTKHTDLASLRNSTPQPIVNPYLSFLNKGMPNFLFGMGPGLLPSGAQFASMLRPGLVYPSVTGSGFHPALPQSASMLFNHHSHQVHRQLNSSSPSSPTGYPSSLPSSPSMSLSPSSSTSSSSSSSSKNHASSSKNPVGTDKASSNSSNQSPSKCKPQLNAMSTLSSSDMGKVNGSESVKNMSPKHEKSSVANQEHRSEAKSKGFSVLPSEETKVSASKTSNNNNTLSLTKSKPQSSHMEGGKLPLDVSNLVSKESGKCSNDQSTTKPKTPSSSMVQTQQS